MTIADKTFTAPWDIFPQAATGQELGHAANLWDLFTREVTFGGATGTNVITVPDNFANAVNLVDAGGIEYLRVITTNAQPEVVWNDGGADIDFRWRRVGGATVLFVQGSNGFIGSGTVTPEAKFHNIATAFPVMLNERTVSAVTGRVGAYLLKVTTSANMIDGLGPAMYFGIEDNAAVQNLIGVVSVVRDGADNSGMLRLETYNAGALAPRLVINAGGDTYWIGDSVGLLYGSMYAAAEIVVPIGDANPTEVENAAQDGWTAGELNGVTFPGGGTEHYLTITIPGRYEILWNMSFHIAMGAGSAIHGGVMIDGVAVRDNGEAHRDVANTNDTGNMGAPCIADLPNGNEEISLWILNDNSNDVHVVHTTVTVKQIGGT